MGRYSSQILPVISAPRRVGICPLSSTKLVSALDPVGRFGSSETDWKLLLSGKSPVEFTSLGRWWGNDPVHKRQAEIDIMGEQNKNTALFAECKWTNEKVDLGVLETLIERSNLFAYQKKHFFLFSKSGFTKGCIEKAKQLGNATLKTYADMIHDKGD